MLLLERTRRRRRRRLLCAVRGADGRSSAHLGERLLLLQLPLLQVRSLLQVHHLLLQQMRRELVAAAVRKARPLVGLRVRESGGSRSCGLRRAAHLGNGWHPLFPTPELLLQKLDSRAGRQRP